MASVADFPIFFVVEAKAGQAIASFQTLNAELDKLALKTDVVGGKFGQMQTISKVAGRALLGIGAVFAGVGYESVKAAISVRAAQAKLKTAIEDTGVSYKAAQPAVEQMVQKMANLTFGSEDTMQSLAQLTAATRDPAMALKSMGVVADLAAFQNETLAQASDTVARAALGQSRGLQTLGIALGKTIPKGATYAEILQAIEVRTKNAAAQSAKDQPWKVLQANLKLLSEQIGGPLLDNLNKLSTWLLKDDKLKKWGNDLKNNEGIIKDIALGLAGLFAINKVVQFYNWIKKLGGVFKEIKGDASKVYAPIEEFFAAFKQDAVAIGALKTIGGLFGSILGSIADILSKFGTFFLAVTSVKEILFPSKTKQPALTPAQIAYMKAHPGGALPMQYGPSAAQQLHDFIFGSGTTSAPATEKNYLSPSYLATLQGKTGSLTSIMAMITAAEKKAGGKVSVSKAKKGIVDYSTSTGLNIQVQIDGTQATIKSIKVGNSKVK